MNSGKIWTLLAVIAAYLLIVSLYPVTAPLFTPIVLITVAAFLFSENSHSPTAYILTGLLFSKLSFNYHLAKEGDEWLKKQTEVALAFDWKIWLAISILGLILFFFREKLGKFIK